MARDPYTVLGVRQGASAEELHDAYRRLVKVHHPDRNGGSAESTRRFQEIQEAYDEARKPGSRARARPASASPPPRPRARARADDGSIADRMRDLERELREAQAARERARKEARDAVRDATGGPSDEDLGYVTTDDSFGKIFADVREEVSTRFSEARQHPAVRRVADLIDGIDGLTDRDRRRDQP